MAKNGGGLRRNERQRLEDAYEEWTLAIALISALHNACCKWGPIEQCSLTREAARTMQEQEWGIQRTAISTPPTGAMGDRTTLGRTHRCATIATNPRGHRSLPNQLVILLRPLLVRPPLRAALPK